MKCKQIFKKALSVFLAVVMVVTAMATTFSVFAADTFQVSYTAPAIPMYEQTKIDLNNIGVQMTADSSYTSGTNIIWSVAENQTGIALDTTTKTLTALEKGRYKLVVSDGSNQKNVWVIVAEQGATEFALVDYDFTNGSVTALDSAEWKYYYHENQSNNNILAQGKYFDSQTNKGYSISSDGITIAVPNVPSGNQTNVPSVSLINKSEILADFADYTLSATVNGSTMGNDSNNTGIGFISRATITGDELVYTNQGYNAEYFGMKTGIFSTVYNRAMKTGIGSYGTGVTNSPFLADRTQFRTMKITYSGKYITAYIDDLNVCTEVDLNATQNSGENYIYTLNRGYAGIAARYQANVTCKNFKVTLNSNAMPDYKYLIEPPEVFNVSFVSPAIPMYEMTVVNLNYVDVQMTDGAEYTSGADITWGLAEAYTGVSFNEATKKITAIESGKYKLVANDGSASKNVWVIVAEQGATEFALVDYDFTNGSVTALDSAEWKYYYHENQSNNNILAQGKYFDSQTNKGYSISSDGITIAVPNAPSGNYTNVPSVSLINKSEILADFADYTLSATVNGSTMGNDANNTGIGFISRATITGDELVYTNQGYNAEYFGMKTGIFSTVYNRAMKTGIGSYGTGVTNSPFLADRTQFRTMKITYSGKYITAYIDDLNVCTEVDLNATQNSGGNYIYTLNRGYAGVAARYQANVTCKNFKVTLNSNAMPDAEEFEYDISDLKVLKNTIFDLSGIKVKFDAAGIIDGKDVNFDNTRNEYGEVSDGKFVAFNEGEVTINANYNGEAKSLTVYVVAENANTVSSSFAGEDITVTPVEDTNSDAVYDVTVIVPDGKEIAPMGLTVLENGTDLNVYQNVGSSANVFRIETLAIEAVNISAEYIDAGEIAVAPLGATIRPAATGIKTGIKFGMRSNVIRDVALVDAGKLNGSNITVTEVGTLLIPKVLLSGDNTILDVNNNDAVKSIAKKLANSNDGFSDYTAVLIDVPESMYGVEIVACGYVAYKADGSDTVEYIYSDAVTRSYNQVYDLAEPARKLKNDDGSYQSGVEFDTLLESKTNKADYKVGETITFAFRNKGVYKLKYNLYQGNLDGNAVKGGTYTGKVLKLSTKMNVAGTVRLELIVLDKNNNQVARFTRRVTVDADSVNRMETIVSSADGATVVKAMNGYEGTPGGVLTNPGVVDGYNVAELHTTDTASSVFSADCYQFNSSLSDTRVTSASKIRITYKYVPAENTTTNLEKLLENKPLINVLTGGIGGVTAKDKIVANEWTVAEFDLSNSSKLTNNAMIEIGQIHMRLLSNFATGLPDGATNTYGSSPAIHIDPADTLYVGEVQIVKNYDYTITFDANNGVAAPNPEYITDTFGIMLDGSEPRRIGYSFAGWGTSQEATPEEKITAGFVPVKDMTLYAIWVEDNDYNLGKMAICEQINAQPNVIAAGEKLYSDSTDTFSANVPDYLVGCEYAFGTKAAKQLLIFDEGWLYILVPDNGAEMNSLMEQGYIKLDTIPAGSLSDSINSDYALMYSYAKFINYNTRINVSDEAIVVANITWAEESLNEPETIIYSLDEENPDHQIYLNGKRNFSGCPSITQTNDGTFWLGVTSGGTGEDIHNYVMLYRSDDGETYGEPVLVMDPQAPVRTSEPLVWCDPDGKLWVFWSQAYMNEYIYKNSNSDGRMGVWCMSSDDNGQTWTEPKRICHGFTNQNPTVLSDGTWMLSVNIWNNNSNHSELDYLKHPSVYVSTDKGETWTLKGVCSNHSLSYFFENAVIELADGRLWMIIRTLTGLESSYSSDGGATWTDAVNAGISSTDSRAAFDKLPNGNIIVIAHDDELANGKREYVTVWRFDENGNKLEGKLLIDEVGYYPNTHITADGTIYITYDRNRGDGGNAMIARITEDDIIAGELVNEDSFIKLLAFKGNNTYVSTATVTFDTKGGDAIESLIFTATPASNAKPNPVWFTVRALPKAKKEGFTFIGWAVTDGGPVVYEAGYQYTPSSEKETLYAVYE